MEKKKIYRYNDPFKGLVIALLESGQIKSLTEASRLLAIGGHGTIKNWLIQAGKQHLIPKIKMRTLQSEMTRLKESGDTGLYDLVKKNLDDRGVDINLEN